jgi:uncharacterized protein YggE
MRLLPSVLVAALVLCATVAFSQSADPSMPGITVTGRAEATVPPDRVTLHIGVLADGRTAGDAVERMRRDASALFETLESAGIPAADIGTTALELRAVRDPNGRPEPGRAPRITGFEAETRISITLDDLPALSALLDAAVQVGANRIDGIRFGLADPDAAVEGLRAAAVRDAMARAEAYADAAGITLGPVLEIRDTPGGGSFPMGRMMSAEAGVPIAPGTLQLSAEVLMRFAIGD